ncbi:MAG TPA: hypothetical protein VE619_06640 [Nitrososphaeraceae archaeon]|jgi:hypothetical protein|nr:hypothetical protein [Nitrososphaeraceae archaeon]HZC20171.1 hypothetical protein [Nitrososphaeraceae archaeon]
MKAERETGNLDRDDQCDYQYIDDGTIRSGHHTAAAKNNRIYPKNHLDVYRCWYSIITVL